MRTIIAVGVVLLAACASGGGNAAKSSEGGDARSAAAPRSSRDLITRAQIEQMSVQDAYEMVQRMRPEYLREQRGANSLSRTAPPLLAVVYVDGVKRGGPDSLRGMRPAEVEEIRFMSGTDATTRYGTDHGGGAIEVKTRRR